jgi:hypothetical protein
MTGSPPTMSPPETTSNPISAVTVLDRQKVVFTLPRTQVIVCTDSLDNICTAPTSCNANGSAKFDPGNNLNVVTAEQRNGLWTIVGGYTISFPSQCTVTCQGNCLCKTCSLSIVLSEPPPTATMSTPAAPTVETPTITAAPSIAASDSLGQSETSRSSTAKRRYYWTEVMLFTYSSSYLL